MTIVEFLNARLEEDEERARSPHLRTVYVGQTRADVRERAEVEAKRRIVALHPIVEPYLSSDRREYPNGACDTCGFDDSRVMEHGPCPTLRLLALPYADHPDYDEAWRP